MTFGSGRQTAGKELGNRKRGLGVLAEERIGVFHHQKRGRLQHTDGGGAGFAGKRGYLAKHVTALVAGGDALPLLDDLDCALF